MNDDLGALDHHVDRVLAGGADIATGLAGQCDGLAIRAQRPTVGSMVELPVLSIHGHAYIVRLLAPGAQRELAGQTPEGSVPAIPPPPAEGSPMMLASMSAPERPPWAPQPPAETTRNPKIHALAKILMIHGLEMIYG